MSKVFDTTFRPLTHDQLQPPKLPKQIRDQLDAANWIQRQIVEHAIDSPKPGPRKTTPPYKPLIFFTADSAGELEDLVTKYASAIGYKTRGNKRIGKAALYANLVQYFTLLKRHGVTLPRNKSLSARACQFGLGEILRRHGCTDLTDRALMNGENRKKVAAKMDRIFTRVSKTLEQRPPQ
jgi:hypothetical protein